MENIVINDCNLKPNGGFLKKINTQQNTFNVKNSFDCLLNTAKNNKNSWLNYKLHNSISVVANKELLKYIPVKESSLNYVDTQIFKE